MITHKKPAMVIHPGELLKDELDARAWTQKGFARIIGRPEKTISAIIQGKKDITPETAIEIAAALGTSPDVWNTMQAKYNLHVAAQKSKVREPIERRARLYSVAPIDELIARGYVTAGKTIDEMELSLCGFLGLQTISDTCRCTAAFRIARHTAAIDNPPVIAWLKIIEQKSRNIECPVFSESALKRILPDIVANSKSKEGCREVVQKLREAGVRLVFEPHFSGTRIDGAVIYVDGAPVIGMTIRLDRIDNFWFTLMHELGHIVLKHETGYVDVDVIGNTDAPDEIKANEWAADRLLSNEAYEKFVTRTKPYFARKAIVEFARKIGVHPGIVIGRLQRDGLVPWQNLRDLLEKVSPVVTQ